MLRWRISGLALPLLAQLLGCAGCGRVRHPDDASLDAWVGLDAGRPIDAGSDAERPFDGGFDAGSPIDAGVIDAGPPVPCPDASRDAAADEPQFLSCRGTVSRACDGIGRLTCADWASRWADAGFIDPAVVCVQGAPQGCARANACTHDWDIETCTCGSGPYCGPGQMCARACAGGEYVCLACPN